jgi:hypothetical protein
MAKLLLVNHFHTDLVVSVQKKSGRRTQTLGCCVPANGAVDVCEHFAMGEDEVRALLLASPDFQHLMARGHLLELVTPEEALVVPEGAPRGGDPLPPAPVVPVVNPVVAMLLEEAKAAETVPLPRLVEELVSDDDGSAEAAVDSADAPALDPNAKSVLSSATPSTQWTRDQLLAYAEEHGVAVNPSDSKNVVLRKLRGM